MTSTISSFLVSQPPSESVTNGLGIAKSAGHFSSLTPAAFGTADCSAFLRLSFFGFYDTTLFRPPWLLLLFGFSQCMSPGLWPRSPSPSSCFPRWPHPIPWLYLITFSPQLLYLAMLLASLFLRAPSILRSLTFFALVVPSAWNILPQDLHWLPPFFHSPATWTSPLWRGSLWHPTKVAIQMLSITPSNFNLLQTHHYLYLPLNISSIDVRTVKTPCLPGAYTFVGEVR